MRRASLGTSPSIKILKGCEASPCQRVVSGIIIFLTLFTPREFGISFVRNAPLILIIAKREEVNEMATGTRTAAPDALIVLLVGLVLASSED